MFRRVPPCSAVSRHVPPSFLQPHSAPGGGRDLAKRWPELCHNRDVAFGVQAAAILAPAIAHYLGSFSGKSARIVMLGNSQQRRSTAALRALW